MGIPLEPSTLGRKTHALAIGGFEVSRVTLPAHLRLAPHAHSHAQICLVRQGRYREEVDGYTAMLEPGSALFRPAQCTHGNRVGSHSVGVILIDVDLSTMPALHGIGLENRPIYAPPGVFEDTAIALQAELECPDRFSPIVIATLIPLCAIRLLRLIGQSKNKQPAWFESALNIVRAQFAQKITIGGLAQQAGTTEGQLARAFRRYMQRSVREFVADLRMDEARRQLLDSDLSIAQIAQQLGYFDQSHLGRHFRQRFHVSPARFRTAWRNRA